MKLETKSVELYNLSGGQLNHYKTLKMNEHAHLAILLPEIIPKKIIKQMDKIHVYATYKMDGKIILNRWKDYFHRTD